MSENSAIEWTDTTWNPVTGCTKRRPHGATAEALADGTATQADLARRFNVSQKYDFKTTLVRMAASKAE
jgi:protein gp37